MGITHLFEMTRRDIYRCAGLIVAYVAVAGVSLKVALVHGMVSPVWPPTGLAIAALTLGGLRLWPAITVGAGAATFFFAHDALPIAGGIAAGNTVEALLGAWVLQRLGVSGEVTRVRDAIAILAVALVAPLPAATGGALSLTLGGLSPWERYPWLWLVWWMGNFMGALIVLPLLLAWGGKRSPVKYPHRPLELAGALLLAAVLINVWHSAAHALPVLNLPFLPLTTFLFPPVLWAMLRLRPRETMLVLASVSALAVAYIGGGSESEMVRSLFALQLVLFGVGGSWLVLLGALAERDQSQAALRESEAQLRATIEDATVGIVHISLPERRLLRVNEAFCRIMGYERDALLMRTMADITYPDDRQIGAEQFAKLLAGDMSTFRMDKRYVRKDGEIIWARASISLVEGAGTTPFAVSIVEDVTKATLSALAQRDAEHRLELAVAIAKLGFWEWDLPGDEVYLSPMWKQQLGYAEGELGSRPEEVSSRLSPDDLDRVRDYMAGYLAQPGAEFSIDYRLRHRDGHYRWFAARATPLTDDAGKVVKLIGTQLDITHLKESEQRVREAALHDPLTGLANRALIFEYGRHLLAAARRSHGHGALLFVDLDRFKQINDLYGHDIGDRLLQEVAMRLIACTRLEDLVGRLGGDEFVIILHHIDTHHPDHATVVAQHVLDSIGQPFLIDTLELSVSPSIGITYYPEHGTEIDTLLHAADLAMYQAKEFGRANYQIYTSDLCERAEAARSLEAKLRYALKNHGLKLHYQPVIDIKSRRLMGVEALVRLTGEDAEEISPATFIPIAESAGLIGELGEWVAIEACRQHKAWRSQGLPPVKIAINVSPLQLRQRAFADRLGQIIDDAGIDPACFEIEVTESALMESVDEAIEILAHIRSLGVKIALDDFGTGHSSLSNLSVLPLNKLKIDQSFVRRIEGDRTSRVITNAIISLARTLELEVVGEGIESSETLRYLDKQACDQAQGFLFSEPLPADAFARWYRRHAGNNLH
ncbi:MAG TPA: EAL domain-containing protein [Azonexus sp.]|nr:EAL domain-containing protein [Azonexus sp.]